MLLSSMLILVPIGVTVIVAAFQWLQTRRRDRAFAASHGCQRPVRLSRLRNIVEQVKAIRSRTWLDMWCRRYLKVGTTFQSATVSIQPMIFTNDPENIKTILATDFENFGLGNRRWNWIGPLVGPGIFLNDGPAWKHSRAMIRPTFAKMQMLDLSTFESHFQDLLTALPPPNQQSGLVEVDLQPLFFRMTLDSASEVLLGRAMSFRSQLDPPGSASLRFMDAFDSAQVKIHRRSLLHRGWMKPVGLLYFLLKGNKEDWFEEACRTTHSIMDEMIAEFLRSLYQKPFSPEADKEDEGKGKKYVFIDELAKTTQNPLELRHELLNVLIAGRDTTASLLSNAFFMLARHPDVWARLHAEVDETFEGRLPDYTTLRNMKQVRNLLNECLRLYPPVSVNSRAAKANTTLPRGGGLDGQSPVFVKDGQEVMYHVYCLHRSTDTFGPDADVFRPDRWDDPALRPGWGYIPFNGGARICLGQQFALTEASYTLVRLVQEFASIESRGTERDWKPVVEIITRSRHGAMVALKKAEKEGRASLGKG